MERKLLAALLVLLITIGVNAQSPQGIPGGGGRPQGPPPEGMERRSTSAENKLILEVFPEIPNLTLEQREKVGSLLTKERKEIMKQMDEKRKIEEAIEDRLTEKEQKKIDKIDKKILSLKGKTNKKVKKVLTEEQYLVFLDKRENFKFRSQGGERPPRGEGESSDRPLPGN